MKYIYTLLVVTLSTSIFCQVDIDVYNTQVKQNALLESAIKRMKSDSINMNLEIVKNKSDIDALNKKVKESSSLANEVKKIEDKLTNTNTLLEKTKEDNEDLKKELTKVNKENAKLDKGKKNKENKQLKKDIDILNSKIAKLESDLASEKSKSTQLNNDLKTKSKEALDLTTKLNDCKIKTQDLTKVEQEKIQLEEDLKKKDEEIEKTKADIKQYSGVLSEVIKELKTDVNLFVGGNNFNTNDSRYNNFNTTINKYAKDFPNNADLNALCTKLKAHKDLAKQLSAGKNALYNAYNPIEVNNGISTMQQVKSRGNANASQEADRVIRLLRGYCEMQDYVRFEIFFLDEHPTEQYKRDDIQKLKNEANEYPYLITALDEKSRNISIKGTNIPKVICN